MVLTGNGESGFDSGEGAASSKTEVVTKITIPLVAGKKEDCCHLPSSVSVSRVFGPVPGRMFSQSVFSVSVFDGTNALHNRNLK